MHIKKILQRLIVACFVLGVSFTASAQIQVSGVVTDETGEPFPGVTVIDVESNTGVITNINGEYVIRVERGRTLQFSFIGMVTQRIVVGDKLTINVALKSDAINLDEIQVIGYGEQRRITVTGAISSIGSDEILKSPSANVTNSLAGRITGLAAVQGTGQPGADEARLFVRGMATLNNSSPLTLVDGVERDFTQIDPEEIESISILKDASATAVFGVKGANGVIIVTTKRGIKGRPRISVSTSMGAQQPTIMARKSNSLEFALGHNERNINDGGNPSTNLFSEEVLDVFRNGGNLLYPDTDWIDYLFRDYAIQSKTNVTISGGNDNVRYFISLGHLSQDGMLSDLDPRYDDNYTFNRFNYRSNLDIDITKTTLLKLTLGGRTEIRNHPRTMDGGLWLVASWAQPMAGAGIVDGKWISTAYNNIAMEMKDPLRGFYGSGYERENRPVLNFDMDLEQKLDFITKGLEVRVKGSYNTTYTHMKRRGSSPNRYESIKDPFDPDNIVLRKVEDSGSWGFFEETSKARNWYMQASLNYNRKFGNHDISGLVLYNQQVNYYPSQYTDIPQRTLGLVGRITYNYKTKYLMDINMGYNGSENFPDDKRFGWFPALSLGWIMTEESFMDNVDLLTFLKIRGSYGLVGNDRIGGNRFLYLPDAWSYTGAGYNFGYDNPRDRSGAVPLRIGNPNVTWETAAKRNIGFDAAFMKDKLRTSFDLFHEHRKDILITRQVIPSFVAANLPAVNLGEVENKGYEVEVKWMDKVGALSYNIGFNLSYARNKVLFKDEIPQPYDYLYETGQPLGQIFGFITDGFFTEEVNTITDPNYAVHSGTRYPGDVKYKDLNNDGVIDDFDRMPIGYSSIVPEYNYGINAGISWKGVDFSMTWAGVQNTSRVPTGTMMEPYGGGGFGLYSHLYEGRWTPETAETAVYPRFSNISKTNNYRISDLYVLDASFLRLKNVELGYTINSPALKRIGLRNVRIYVNGFNLLTFTNFNIYDPESNPGNGAYPMIKVYNTGVKFNF